MQIIQMGKLPPFIEFALCVSEQALSDAKWFPNSKIDQERTVNILLRFTNILKVF